MSGTASALSNLRLLETMKQRANIDELTGLYNRRFLEDYGRKLIAIARRKESPVGVIMMDLDHFKEFNDRYGHAVGDAALKRFAETAAANMRSTDVIGRLGGEEFCCLLSYTALEQAERVAERIRQQVEKTVVEIPGSFERTTVSIGVASTDPFGYDIYTLMRLADKAVYDAKRQGRNRVVTALPPEERLRLVSG